LTLFVEWSTALQDVLNAFLAKTSQFLPKLVGALLLLFIGWLIARLLRSIGTNVVSTVERVLSQSSIARTGASVRLPLVSARVVGSLLFWLVLLFFVTAAAEVLGLSIFAAWLAQLVGFLPTIAAGGLIIVVGVLASRMARQLIEAAPVADGQAQRALLGRMVQAAILITAVLVGADQIGIRITLLVIMAAVVIGSLVGAAALAVSLASRSWVANLIGSHYLRWPGQPAGQAAQRRGDRAAGGTAVRRGQPWLMPPACRWPTSSPTRPMPPACSKACRRPMPPTGWPRHRCGSQHLSPARCCRCSRPGRWTG
jgi:hypothetical protein